MTRKAYRLFAGLLLGGLLLGGTVQAREIPVVTGTHWTAASVSEKKAFLVGIGTVLMMEQAWYGDHPPSREQSFIPAMIDGLDTYTLSGIQEWLDTWYAAHPDQIEQPVMALIWQELVLPHLASQ